MDSSLWFDTINLGWFQCLYLGVSAYDLKKVQYFRLKIIFFILTNGVDPDEMPQYVAFHLCLHCLQKNMLVVFSIQRINDILV